LKEISDLVIHADDMLKHDKLSAAEKDALHAFIDTCEDDACATPRRRWPSCYRSARDTPMARRNH
jgi:hypothetical protein